MNIYDENLFVPTAGFMGIPCSYELAGVGAAVIGVPFDCGLHQTRIGSRLGPAAIREQSPLVRAYEPPDQDYDALDLLKVVDCGDVKVQSAALRQSHVAIEEAAWRVVSNGAAPVALGGDGAITLPLMRAANRAYPDLVLLHIDAHTDTFSGDGPEERHRFNPATTYTRAAEERLVDTHASFHVGARGATYLPQAWEHARHLGYGVIPDHVFRSRGMAAIVADVRKVIEGRPVYLSFDMDYFDPSCAPGVCTPTWGGASAYEGLQLLRAFSGLDIVACDVNTVSPPHDVGGMTAFLAATCVRECLYLVHAGRKSGKSL